MIYLEMSGRLGNQMFRYSFARRVALLCKEELIIDFSRVYEHGESKNGWNNSLKLFKSTEYIEKNNSKKEVFLKNATYNQKFWYYTYKVISRLLKKNKRILKKFQLSMQPILNKNNLYFLELGYYNYDFKYLKRNKVKYICGCFECSNYFNDIQETIKKEFVSKNPPAKKNKKLYNKIINSNSICITIRRGDFVTNKKNKKLYDICNAEYYEKAIALMKKKVQKPVFIAFSDDIQWAKENINFGNSPAFFEDGTDTLDEKLRLMSSCKHFIISNSTFSWWAQYLSKNKEKIVISPDRWYKTKLKSDLIEKEWIKINTNKE